MAYVWLGALGFLPGYLFELAGLRPIPLARPILWLVAFGLLTYSLAMVSSSSEQFWLPGWLSGLGWALVPLTALLLIYSMFLEIPFRRVYLARSPGPALVRTGTYALVRHPTVLWFALLLLSLLLATRSQLLLLTLPLWTALDIGWVALQEKVSLRRAFPDYINYQRTTPMLLPKRQSIAACLRSFRPNFRRSQLSGRWQR